MESGWICRVADRLHHPNPPMMKAREFRGLFAMCILSGGGRRCLAKNIFYHSLLALNEITANMLLENKLCHGAPFYVLGPIITDIAPGYDHITSAIGGAIAAANGADFLFFVTPAEHLRLPNLDDMKEGIIAARIAAHAGDIAKGIPGARDWDNKMSAARADVHVPRMIELAIDPEKARRIEKNRHLNVKIPVPCAVKCVPCWKIYSSCSAVTR